MMTNMGVIDRAMRFGVGLVLLGLALEVYGPGLDGPWSWLAGLVGALLAGTALLRFCPAYHLFGVTTCAE